MQAHRNRWLIAVSAIAIHLSIGSVYAYSVYQNPLNESLGWDIGLVTFAFTTAIFFLGMTAAFMGKFVERNGPSRSSLIAAILFGTGTLGAGLGVQLESFPMFVLFYGVIGGFGLGIGYISPVATLVRWFPDRRGLATGMAVLGFGAGSLITSPVAEWLMGMISIPATFYTLGVAYLILMIAGSSYISPPPKGWEPANMQKVREKRKEKEKKTKVKQGDLAQLEARESLKTFRFYLLWGMMFINISAGIMLLAVASNMTQAITGVGSATAATIVGVMGFFNGLGRIGWAGASDYIGRTNTYIIFFVLQLIAFILLPLTTNVVIFAILLYIIMTCYGGGFACLPAYIGDLFGTKQLGAIHGYTLTAWAMAGVFGPTAVSTIVELTDDFTAAFVLFIFLLALALLMAILMHFNIKKIRRQQEEPS
ncbi:L-lactate MFS transporter [Natribacillus halophilus]|uniref:MFS transporter, OFA family, oxalate/formate antiporter n=1 Tax=Natribacillus halophilus TaxID=549003 RepID=A0A1G8MUW6_9BACI|nr:OFA family MFS transporter [Natribacillus halophilus]SDI71704.1 MFS transporter, OFA family, oxalate/formate antiporter [Natribacillus halophilus]